MTEKPDGKSVTPKPGAMDAYVIKDPEAFARNLARMVEEAGHAASAWVGPRESGEKSDTYAEPMADMVKTFSKVSEYWLSDPQRALDAQTRLFSSYLDIWSNSIKRMNDEELAEFAEPERGDKRFSDEDWKANAFFSFIKQTYLVTSKWAAELVENAETLDEHTRHKATFYMKQISNAVSPSNFMVSNPEIFKETISTNGANLVAGMKMLAEDIEAGHGELKLRQSDYSKFALGKNIALTPGKVVAKNDLVEIIQYEPRTDEVLKRPLLICPPWINKFYILDLNPDKSFIGWAVDQGHTVFVISWVNPDQRHAKLDWNDYIDQGISFALDAVEKATGEKQVNAIGYCVGGTLLAASLALFARENRDRVATATFFATQVDFEHAGDLKVFVDEDQLCSLETQMKKVGYLDGSRMATAFNLLRSGDLIWPYVVNNYMKGKEPMPFDLLYWNSDATRMSAANHIFYLRNCYLENNLARGKMELHGKPVSLKDVKIPVYNLATKDDHIAPALSVFEGSKCFGGDVTYVLGGSGHIAGVINTPKKTKYQYWAGPNVDGSLEDWMEKAAVTEGSWWPHWQKWIESHDDARVPARKKLGGAKLKPIEDAPGSYVKERI